MKHEFEDFDDFVNDDIVNKKKLKKKVNGKKKGSRTELDLTKVLTARFGQNFSRSVGSGNRWSQVDHLPKHAREVFSGDLVVPEGFKFVIESKGGYDGIDMTSIFVRGNSELDSFLEQAINDGKRCGRKPMLCWKKTRKPWLAFVLTSDLHDHVFKYSVKYKDWTGTALEHLLQLPDSFFMSTNQDCNQIIHSP
jgi:Holliday junction resolvase